MSAQKTPIKKQKKLNKKKGQSAAVLSIFGVGAMTDKGRKEVAAWLSRQANFIVKDGRAYTERWFTARYLYR